MELELIGCFEVFNVWCMKEKLRVIFWVYFEYLGELSDIYLEGEVWEEG